MSIFSRKPKTTVPPDPRPRQTDDYEAQAADSWKRRINVINELLASKKCRTRGDITSYGDGSVVIHMGSIPPDMVPLAAYKEYYEPFGYRVGKSCHTLNMEDPRCPNFDDPDPRHHYQHDVTVSIMPGR
ncbi:MAG TPA: hypothetical protein VH144_00440 [Candidatus Saccharimonadales bacterium]|nr:hypothetical protein [Candidatus Saccharimonadales bacterium]